MMAGGHRHLPLDKIVGLAVEALAVNDHLDIVRVILLGGLAGGLLCGRWWSLLGRSSGPLDRQDHKLLPVLLGQLHRCDEVSGEREEPERNMGFSILLVPCRVVRLPSRVRGGVGKLRNGLVARGRVAWAARSWTQGGSTGWDRWGIPWCCGGIRWG